MVNPLLTILAASVATVVPTVATPPAVVPQAVACQTESALFEYLNAAERNDLKEAARLIAGACTPLAGLHYEIVANENGISTIRLFRRQGDWASSRLAVMLDEMAPTD